MKLAMVCRSSQSSTRLAMDTNRTQVWTAQPKIGFYILFLIEPSETKSIKLQESDSEKTTLYYDDLLTSREATVCFVYQTPVANPKPAFVTVQDYYNTEAKTDQQFSLVNRQVSCVF